MNFSLFGATLTLGLGSFVACGTSQSSGLTPSLTGTTSCDLASAFICTEYYAPTSAEQAKESCAQSQGVFSATSGCKGQGKILGCETSVKSIQASTVWYYEQEVANSAKNICSDLTNASSGVTSKVVTP